MYLNAIVFRQQQLKNLSNVINYNLYKNNRTLIIYLPIIIWKLFLFKTQ